MLNPGRATYQLQDQAAAAPTQAHVKGARRRVIKARVSIPRSTRPGACPPRDEPLTHCRTRPAAADAATWSKQEVKVGRSGVVKASVSIQHPQVDRNRRARPVTSHLRSEASSRGSRRRHVEQKVEAESRRFIKPRVSIQHSADKNRRQPNCDEPLTTCRTERR